MLTVAAIILTKNSERTIGQCIDAVKPAVDEIIVVDTGSTDSTVQIVESKGLRVHHFEWRDDFSAARNYAQSLATTDWVIHVDSDEILYADDSDEIRATATRFNDVQNTVVSVLQMNRMRGVEYPFHMSRMFKNRAGFQWRNSIHEQVFVNDSVPSYIRASIRFLHDGYDGNATDTKSKYERNIRILERERDQRPNDASVEFYLAREKKSAGRADEEILYHARRAYGLLRNGDLNISPTIKALLVSTLLHTGDIDNAQQVVDDMIANHPDYPDTFYLKSIIGCMRAASYVTQASKDMDEAKRLCGTYTGVPFDHEIAVWKADLSFGDMQRFSGNLVKARELYTSVLPYYPRIEMNIRQIDQQAVKLSEMLNNSHGV